jgi:hypothetical protein
MVTQFGRRMIARSAIGAAFALAFAAIAAMAPPARAQGATPTPTPALGRSEAANHAADFQMIAEGWFLNRRCKFLTGEPARAFDWHLAKMTAGFGRALGRQFLHRMDKTAHSAAYAEKYGNCNVTARRYVTQTFDRARAFTTNVLGLTYVAGVSEWQDYLQDFGGIAARVDIERRCNHLPKSIRSDVYSAYDKLRLRLREHLGDAAVDKTIADAKRFAANPRFAECS